MITNVHQTTGNVQHKCDVKHGISTLE